jgi:hypothetical protein
MSFSWDLVSPAYGQKQVVDHSKTTQSENIVVYENGSSSHERSMIKVPNSRRPRILGKYYGLPRGKISA